MNSFLWLDIMQKSHMLLLSISVCHTPLSPSPPEVIVFSVLQLFVAIY